MHPPEIENPLWRHLSLRSKLQLSIAGYSLLVLLIISLTLAWFVYSYFHQKERQDVEMLASVLADNSRAAVTFNDPKSAANVLAAARGNPHIRAAVIMADQQVFAAYPSTPDQDLLDILHPGRRVWLDRNNYYASVPIIVADEVKGWLYLKSDLEEWKEVERSLYLVFMGLLIGLFLLTLTISYWLNNHITRPLGALAQWATQVSKAKDFNARAIKHNNDEVGNLVDSLNLMLSELSKQESILSWNEVLEKEIQIRKEVEKDLIALRNRADSANRAKSQFLANMSHELRTPLNAIIGYSEILQDVINEPDFAREEIAHDISKIHSAGRHLLTLINDVLDISKIEAGKIDLNLEEFNADEVIDDVIGTIRPLAESRGNKLELDVHCDLGIIYSDATKIRQILLNLMSNAVKFTHQGSVKLSCSRSEGDEGELVIFEVQDSGIGIKQEHLETIFQPFSQADASTTRKYGGTGLGLAISNSFAQMMGGRIEVASQLDQGTIFKVILPITQTALTIEANASSEAPLTDSPTLFSQKMRLLLIDDDEAVHSALRHQLSQLNFSLFSALTGEVGLRMALSEQYHLIVLDIFMDGIDGWQVLQTLKSDPRTAHIPVVLYSVTADHSKGYALGASDFLVKPVNRDTLVKVLERFRHPEATPRLLLVSADEFLRDSLNEVLGSSYDVIRSSDRESCERLLKSNNLSVILLDMQNPYAETFDLIEQIRDEPAYDSIPLIVLSDRNYTLEESAHLKKHVSAMFQKGVDDNHDLLRVLELMLEHPVEPETI